MKWARSSLNQMLLICSPCKSCLPHGVRLVLTSSKTWWRLCANCITIGIIPFTCVRFCLFGLYFAVFLICRCNFSDWHLWSKQLSIFLQFALFFPSTQTQGRQRRIGNDFTTPPFMWETEENAFSPALMDWRFIVFLICFANFKRCTLPSAEAII